METVLLVAAEAREFAGILRLAGRGFGLQWPVDHSAAVEWGGRRWLLVANGPGPRLAGLAAEAAVRQERVDVVVSTGFCGGLDPALTAGSIFVASRVEAAAQGIAFEARIPATARSFASGSLISLDRVVRTAEEKRELRQSGAAAVEMEAAAVAEHARKMGAPFYCIRAVTDCAGESFCMDFNRVRDAAGRFSRVRILATALRRPWVRFPELAALARRSRMAARALGDFLADCRF